jgi:Zn-dependent alcohol dehydrogenase
MHQFESKLHMNLIIEVPVLTQANRKMAMTKVEVETPHEGEVRVKMFASGVCYSCLHAYEGSHATPMPMPIVIGD